MRPMHVAVVSFDPITAGLMAARLKASFQSVTTYHFIDDAQAALAKGRAQAVLLDVETISVAEVQQLLTAFFDVPIVCLQASPNAARRRALWSLGIECLYPENVPGIVRALCDHSHIANLSDRYYNAEAELAEKS